MALRVGGAEVGRPGAREHGREAPESDWGLKEGFLEEQILNEDIITDIWGA